MVVDFKTMQETVIPQFYGGEKETIARLFVDENGKIMQGRLKPGASIGVHTHETSSEIIYVLSGKGKAFFDEEWEELEPGQCHYCPKGHTHGLTNGGEEDLVFFAVVPNQ